MRRRRLAIAQAIWREETRERERGLSPVSIDLNFMEASVTRATLRIRDTFFYYCLQSDIFSLLLSRAAVTTAVLRTYVYMN